MAEPRQPSPRAPGLRPAPPSRQTEPRGAPRLLRNDATRRAYFRRASPLLSPRLSVAPGPDPPGPRPAPAPAPRKSPPLPAATPFHRLRQMEHSLVAPGLGSRDGSPRRRPSSPRQVNGLGVLRRSRCRRGARYPCTRYRRKRHRGPRLLQQDCTFEGRRRCDLVRCRSPAFRGYDGRPGHARGYRLRIHRRTRRLRNRMHGPCRTGCRRQSRNLGFQEQKIAPDRKHRNRVGGRDRGRRHRRSDWCRA